MVEKMKDSGIEWIGEIPEGWELSRLKYSADIVMGQSPDSQEISDEPLKYYFMQGNAEFTNLYPNPSIFCETPKKKSRVNDILMSVRAPVGAMNISDKIYGIGRGLCSIKPIKLHEKYLWYFMIKSKEDFLYYSNGSTFDAITTENLLMFYTIIPKFHEQTLIANFLDSQCERIDSIISDIEKQIEILGEYKKSLITETVTKGLDKTVPMKDSGIEWIGQIPEHWEVGRIKDYYKITTGFTPDTTNSDYYDDENGCDWVSISDMQNDIKIISDTKSKISSLYVRETQPQITTKGSLLYSFKLSVGKVTFAGKNMYTNEAIASFLSADNVSLNFLYYSSMFIIENANINIYGAKIMNQELIRTAPIIFPPLNEQTLIANYLDTQCSKIDSIIEDKKEQLNKITEHKKSLIYEYVTGKKRVKGVMNHGN